MKQIFTLAMLCLGTLAIQAQDNCGTAQTIAFGTHNVFMQAGSQVPTPVCSVGENNGPDRGAWFKYMTMVTQTVMVSTAESGLDTRVQVYSGNCGALTCVTGDDDSGPDNTSIAIFTAMAGQTYYIAFDNNWDVNNFSFTFGMPTSNFTPSPIDLTGWYKICVVDMNGDYLDDVVAPTNGGVQILYQNAEGGFTAQTRTTTNTWYMPDWSMAAGDYDKNGYNDMLYGNGNGTILMLANADGTSYEGALESDIDVFSQRTNFIDINNDGNLDAFTCHDVAPNVYFLNDGEGGGTFVQGGLGDYPSGGNYGSIWVDYDNDGDMDLFIAKCRGGGDNAAKDELHRNNGDGTFTNVATDLGLDDLHQSWSSAWADFDNDGDMDVMIGASSPTGGGHRLLSNNGDGTFTNVTTGSGWDTFTTMNIEHVAHDFDNDGYVDVLTGGGNIMYNNGDMTFMPISIAPAMNGPIGDLNNDGFLDIQNDNFIHMNNGNDNNWIKIQLKGVESNGNGIGARVEAYTETDGIEMQIRDVKSGDGFRYMSSLNTHFGFGDTEEITKIIVKWPSGTVDTIMNPEANQSLMVVEGDHVMANEQFAGNDFRLFPNPAKDFMEISGDNLSGITTAEIYDLNGRLVKTAEVNGNRISVQSLAKGTYLLMVKDAQGAKHSSKFIKG